MPAPFAPPERIGFVGLGQMGAPMARNLTRAGFKLALADANAQTVARLTEELGCEAPASLPALGAACRIGITMLPDGKAVREVALALDLARDAVSST